MKGAPSVKIRMIWRSHNGEKSCRPGSSDVIRILVPYTSTEFRPRPIVTTDTCVPPALRHASISLVSSPTSPPLSAT